MVAKQCIECFKKISGHHSKIYCDHCKNIKRSEAKKKYSKQHPRTLEQKESRRKKAYSVYFINCYYCGNLFTSKRKSEKICKNHVDEGYTRQQLASKMWATEKKKKDPRYFSKASGSTWRSQTMDKRYKDTDAYVYMINIQNTNYYKIGVSINPQQRLKAIENGSPFNTYIRAMYYTDFAFAHESYLHSLFKHKRVKNEWFVLNNDDFDLAKKYLE
jgi:hypothetical protein